SRGCTYGVTDPPSISSLARERERTAAQDSLSSDLDVTLLTSTDFGARFEDVSHEAMKMDVQRGIVSEIGGVDDGELLASLESLTCAPRLRGALELETGQLKGWLVDARAPLSPLQLSLDIDGRSICSAIAPRLSGTDSKIDSSDFRFSFTWDGQARCKPGP